MPSNSKPTDIIPKRLKPVRNISIKRKKICVEEIFKESFPIL
jgi:hypothetical protein